MTDRSHVEFIGPPGAGKSTVHRALTTDSRFYGEIYEDAVERLFFREYGKPYRLAYRLVPSPLRSPLGTLFLQRRIQRRMFSEFVANRPAFPAAIEDARRTVSFDPDQVASVMRYAAERYQLGVRTMKPVERLCLDEGFMIGAVSVLWRSEDGFSLQEYFESVPMPQTLVHVTAPTEVCLERQRERGDVVADGHGRLDTEHAQRNHEAACTAVADAAEEAAGTTVVTVETTSAVDVVVDDLKTSLA
jgi:thymidylate kinase